jgi:hypothetical protein
MKMMIRMGKKLLLMWRNSTARIIRISWRRWRGKGLRGSIVRRRWMRLIGSLRSLRLMIRRRRKGRLNLRLIRLIMSSNSIVRQ